MISAEQKEMRRHYIGSSDAAAVCGLDPCRSPYDVWLEKTGKATDRKANETMEAGVLLERAVLDWFEQRTPLGITRDLFHFAGNRCANLDAIVSNAAEIVEAKTTGIVGPKDAGYGEVLEGEFVELPERVIVQVHHQLGVCGAAYQVVWVPVLIGFRGFTLYRVDRNEKVADAIAERGEAFWYRHVQRDIPPDDCRPSLDVLKRIRRTPKKSVSVPDEVVDFWIAARASRLQAEEDEETAQAALLQAMADAEEGTYAGGVVTYFEQKRKAYAVEAKTFRTLRLKAAKQTAALAAKEAT